METIIPTGCGWIWKSQGTNAVKVPVVMPRSKFSCASTHFLVGGWTHDTANVSERRWRCQIYGSYISSWWFQPIWKICSSNWSHLPQIGMNIKMFETTTQFCSYPKTGLNWGQTKCNSLRLLVGTSSASLYRFFSQTPLNFSCGYPFHALGVLVAVTLSLFRASCVVRRAIRIKAPLWWE